MDSKGKGKEILGRFSSERFSWFIIGFACGGSLFLLLWFINFGSVCLCVKYEYEIGSVRMEKNGNEEEWAKRGHFLDRLRLASVACSRSYSTIVWSWLWRGGGGGYDRHCSPGRRRRRRRSSSLSCHVHWSFIHFAAAAARCNVSRYILKVELLMVKRRLDLTCRVDVTGQLNVSVALGHMLYRPKRASEARDGKGKLSWRDTFNWWPFWWWWLAWRENEVIWLSRFPCAFCAFGYTLRSIFTYKLRREWWTGRKEGKFVVVCFGELETKLAWTLATLNLTSVNFGFGARILWEIRH